MNPLLIPLLNPLLNPQILIDMGFWSVLGSIGKAIAGPVIGGLFGSSNNSSTNSTNVKIANMNNAAQKQLQDEQLAWNLEQWERNNEYNKPSAQMQRYRDAGLNPYLMMQGQQGAAGNSAAPASGVQPPQLHTPTMQPYTGWSDVFMQISQHMHEQDMAKADTRKINAEADRIETENEFTRQKALLELEEMRNRGKVSKWQYKNLSSDWQLKRATFSDAVTKARLENDSLTSGIDLQKANLVAVRLQNAMNRFHLKNLPKEFAAQMALQSAQIYAAYGQGIQSRSQANLAQKQADFTVKQTLTEGLRQYGIHLDNKQKDALFDIVVESERNSAYRDSSWFPEGSWWSKSINTVLNPLKGIFSSGVTKSFK